MKIMAVVFAIALMAGSGVSYFSKSESDARYSAKKDTLTAINYFYTKDQVESLIYRSYFTNQLKVLGITSFALPVGANSLLGGTLTMTDGTAYCNLYRVNRDTVITKANFVTTTAGAYTTTGGEYNGIVVYSLNKTTLAMVELARTVDTPALWTAPANVITTVNLNSSITVTEGQLLVTLSNWNANTSTIAPVLATFGTSNGSINFPDNLRTGRSKTAITSPASSYNYNGTDFTGVLSTLVGIWLN